MKPWVKIRYKDLFSSESAPEAITPVLGSLLMLMILVVLAGTAAVSLYNSAGASSQPLMAKISLESCEGGLFNNGPKDERATLENNTIVLVHEGGNSLPIDSVSIKISGYGN